jgi:hypothetical protein
MKPKIFFAFALLVIAAVAQQFYAGGAGKTQSASSQNVPPGWNGQMQVGAVWDSPKWKIAGLSPMTPIVYGDALHLVRFSCVGFTAEFCDYTFGWGTDPCEATHEAATVGVDGEKRALEIIVLTVPNDRSLRLCSASPFPKKKARRKFHIESLSWPLDCNRSESSQGLDFCKVRYWQHKRVGTLQDAFEFDHCSHGGSAAICTLFDYGYKIHPIPLELAELPNEV